MAEKHFEVCGGFEINDEMYALIASQGCILILNRPHDFYPTLNSILIYDTAFFVENQEYEENGMISLSTQVRAGESWTIGVVILAWEEIERGLRYKHDGYNVMIHEFAHQLDQ
jgi:MtfA peptidase